MAEEFTADRLREELKKSQSKCAELETEILRKEETIRKLTAELKVTQTFCAMHRVRDMTLEERVKRRQEALERIRIEYENRAGHRIDLDDTNGDDEID